MDKAGFQIDVRIKSVSRRANQKPRTSRISFYAGTPYVHSKMNISRHGTQAARVPIGMVEKDLWINLQLDLRSFVQECFDEQFLSLEQVYIHGCCKIRRVILTKFQIADSQPYLIEERYSDQDAINYEVFVQDYQNSRPYFVELDALD